MSSLDDSDFKTRPAVGIIPLGTGNDLARTLGWGGGFSGKNSMKGLLLQMAASKVVNLDRWKINFDGKQHGYLPIFNNYFSIGIDAKIAHKFHQERESNPQNFNNQTLNKLKYVSYGASENCKGLENKIEVLIDGKQVKLPKVEGLVILNLPSWAGGTDLWDFKQKDEVVGWKKNSIGDGLLELVGIESTFHIGMIKGGLGSAIKIGQGSEISIKLKEAEYCQIDGEPWLQEASQIEISLFNSVPMLSCLEK